MEYGAPPPGDDYLILGHENFGRVEEVGPSVSEFAVGDYVVASVRRPGSSIFDKIVLQDMTTPMTLTSNAVSISYTDSWRNITPTRQTIW